MEQALKLRRRHFTMLREFHVADFFTLGNAACGMAGIFLAIAFAIEGDLAHFMWAAAMAPAAFIFDVLDGRIARARHEHSALGRELDSLSDVISFGVAPAVLAYVAGMRGGWDVAALIYFVCCGVSRLARYNVTAESLSGEEGKVRYFEGTPIPTSVLLTGVLAVAAWTSAIGDDLWGGSIALGPWEFHWMAVLFVISGSLMISKTLRIPKL